MFPLSLRRIHDYRVIVDNLEKISNVKDNIDSIVTVSDISEDVTTVAGDLTNINAVKNDLTNINTCASSISAIIDAPNQASIASSAANTAKGQVNLSGPASITSGQTELYTISNYNIASTYSVAISEGTVSRNGYLISVNATGSNPPVVLTVTKDSISTNFSLSVTTPGTGIVTPTNLSPLNGISDYFHTVDLASSTFYTYGYSDTHLNSDWELATDVAFSTIVQSVSASSSHKTTITLTGLLEATTYYWRVRYRGASTTVSDWSSPTSFSTATSFASHIGVPGLLGFGVGICNSLPEGMNVLTGTDIYTSDNYGNYQYSDGSIMVWIPAFYYKWGTGSNGLAVNAVDIKHYTYFASVGDANSNGYALHRAFYDNGEIKSGFFIDKYECSNNNGTASSILNGNPLSTNPAHNPLSGLSGSQSNTFGGAIAAAKTRGSNFFCASRFIVSALALLSYAHAKAATGTAACAWYDSNQIINFPKGNNSNALSDTNDSSVKWQSDGYSNCGKTGSAGYGGGAGNVFAKSTHNGQNCGVADLNGNLWEVSPGLTSDGTNLYILKTSAKMSTLTGNNTGSTDLWGSTGISANYDSLGTSYEAWTGASNTLYYGNANQVFSEATSGNGWNVAGAGIPLSGGTGGTNIFGNNPFYNYKPNECCPISGGNWADAARAGVWAFYLNYYRSYSTYHVGFRSACYL